jgi:hypothetical protein
VVTKIAAEYAGVDVPFDANERDHLVIHLQDFQAFDKEVRSGGHSCKDCHSNDEWKHLKDSHSSAAWTMY